MVLVATQSSGLGGAAGLIGIPLLDLRPVVAGVIVAILLVELLWIRGSSFELHMNVVASDPELVQMSGRSAARLRVGVFAVSTAVAGLAGALNVYYLAIVQPTDLGFEQSLNLLVYAVVGGASSGFGPLIGAGALTLLPRVLNVEGTYQTLLLGALLLATMLLRRDGIVGRLPIRITKRRRGGTTNDDDRPRGASAPEVGGELVQQ
jgi:branched-chain amino acid transport system permease protein